MGTGKITLYWYAMCFIVLLLIFVVGSGLVVFGNWQKRRDEKRARRGHQPERDSNESV